ncbi:dihydrolipoyl dehydrogenase family protein [Weissella cibaria]|uniref:dihydrolipoyl dehydrogenase family protein n=1 Tax=Weissella cibaria TaxID=137591 RepID=UPI0007A5D832|nr:NAD(P)/FAD-dependent oxidoreductase [Weissella cibaria]QDG80021.1 NAD(P)/FAD-dependent oxidoreductase [Weissella cibaria]QMU87799.1 NAD(P)/FAD-dependent oxidoreductase [Weissella cibaria]TVV36136.1 NAD(P)/FAD-dependent oxidoreductase [Weissella cibaria]
MTTYDYDVLYIGSGHGTFDGAIPLGAKGKKVGVVEQDLVGGTCPNRGCNAKIVLDSPVAFQRHMEDVHGVVTGDVKIDWPANQAHKHDVIDGLPAFIQGLLDSTDVDVLFGRGTLADAHTVMVNGEAKTADKIVIATGLRPNRLTIPGADLAHDSSDFLNLSDMPNRVTIIGAGYIAMEFATMANAAGSEVTVLMRGTQALRAYHQPFVEQIIADLTSRGVVFDRDTQVDAIVQGADGLVVRGADLAVETDWVLDATGRIPNVEELGLETVGVSYNAKGIVVDDYLRTTVPNIYASGDVIDKVQPKLTPTAIFESLYLMHTFAGETTDPIVYPVIPSVVFTSPRLAQVGVTVAEAEANPELYTMVQNHIPDDWYRQVDQEKIGDNILIFDQAHKLIGATEVSHKADDVINALLPAIEFKFGQAEIERMVHLFPSIASSAWGQL